MKARNLLTLSMIVSCLWHTACGSETTVGGGCTVTEHADDDGATLTCTDGSSYELPGECGPPPSTFLMQHEWNEAEMFRRDCSAEAGLNLHICTQNGDPDCGDQYEQWMNSCDHIWRLWINMIPQRECGTVIFEVEDPQVQSSPATVSYDDPDGDGIHNWHEYSMGLNPCEANSFGTCVASDAEQDYDSDGTPNGQDEYPLCDIHHENDPADWQSDCV